MRRDEAPDSISAHTTRTRNAGGVGCTIHLQARFVDRDDVIAHEVCHCVHDYDELTTFGWKWTLSLEERVRREMRAKACGKKLAGY